MKFLSIAGMMLVGYCFGFWIQAYSLPRIGLHSMDMGQYFWLFVLMLVARMLLEICKAAGGHDD